MRDDRRDGRHSETSTALGHWSWKMFRGLLREYEWVHRGLGIFGHLCFFAGSVMFLWDSWKLAGVWLFIVGAGGMLIDRVCSLVVHYERLRAQGESPL